MSQEAIKTSVSPSPDRPRAGLPLSDFLNQNLTRRALLLRMAGAAVLGGGLAALATAKPALAAEQIAPAVRQKGPDVAPAASNGVATTSEAKPEVALAGPAADGGGVMVEPSWKLLAEYKDRVVQAGDSPTDPNNFWFPQSLAEVPTLSDILIEMRWTGESRQPTGVQGPGFFSGYFRDGNITGWQAAMSGTRLRVDTVGVVGAIASSKVGEGETWEGIVRTYNQGHNFDVTTAGGIVVPLTSSQGFSRPTGRIGVALLPGSRVVVDQLRVSQAEDPAERAALVSQFETLQRELAPRSATIVDPDLPQVYPNEGSQRNEISPVSIATSGPRLLEVAGRVLASDSPRRDTGFFEAGKYGEEGYAALYVVAAGDEVGLRCAYGPNSRSTSKPFPLGVTGPSFDVRAVVIGDKLIAQAVGGEVRQFDLPASFENTRGRAGVSVPPGGVEISRFFVTGP